MRGFSALVAGEEGGGEGFLQGGEVGCGAGVAVVAGGAGEEGAGVGVGEEDEEVVGWEGVEGVVW